MGWFGWFGGRSNRGGAADANLDQSTSLPDIAERNPLDVWHFVTCRAFDAITLAPIANPATILDVACGTGLWPREIARLYPLARVVGFDQNLQQIDRALEEGAWRGDDLPPANCHFERVDALAAWPYGDGAFEYTHARFISPFVPVSQFGALLAEMVRVTRPGGWVEIVDAAQFTSHDPARQFLLQCLRQLYERNGLALEPGPTLARLLRQAELQRVHSRSATITTSTTGDDASWRVANDLVAGMLDAAPQYQEMGIASENQLARAAQQIASAAADATFRIELTTAWGRREPPS